jgi:hypothetical protein
MKIEITKETMQTVWRVIKGLLLVFGGMLGVTITDVSEPSGHMWASFGEGLGMVMAFVCFAAYGAMFLTDKDDD